MFVTDLAGDVVLNQELRGLLETLLQSDRSSFVRAACASALTEAATAFNSTADALLNSLEKDLNDRVKRNCARALRKVALRRVDVRGKLSEILNSDLGENVRVGAAWGLVKVIREDSQLRKMVIQKALSAAELPWVRNACIWALDESLGQDKAVEECLISCLDGSCPLPVRRIAAQSLARAVADEEVEWSRGVVEQIENVLMNLPNPCSHALWALERIVEARELRGGIRLEGILREALQPVAHAITLAFVFGSVARNAQQYHSDIDLLVVGEIRLKEISGALRTAEQILGRRISPAIYTCASFKQRYQGGDPFLTGICRAERIFIKGSDNELGELVAERVSP
jgi:predicted nucleotidyltransferase